MPWFRRGSRSMPGPEIGTFLVVPEETREALRDEANKPQLTAKQAAVLEVLCRGDEPLTTADVCRLAKCTSVPIQALRKQGLLHTVKKRLPVGLAELGRSIVGTGPGQRRQPEQATPRPRQNGRELILTAEQAATLERLAPALESGGFAPFLIHGVTGSGKTEVYLAAIEQVVARGREAIVLVPEISLTPQTIRRFRRRFSRVAVLHSHMSDAERHRHWQSIASGEVQVVVGARSAVFAPTRRLGLIVIDEEHESTFKQETDAAISRARRGRQAGADGRAAGAAGLGHAVAREPGETPTAGATPGCRCPTGWRAVPCPSSRSSTCETRSCRWAA